MGLKISLIGSTGSIGKQTLQVIDHLGIKPVALTAGKNINEFEMQCRKYLPQLAVLADEDAALDLRIRLKDTPVIVYGGSDAMCEAAAHPDTDITLVAAAGIAGLRTTLAAIDNVPKIALANKESIVSAGQIIKKRIANSKTVLLPVDSELTSIHSCLHNKSNDEVSSITLTASGGPFFGRSYESLQKVTADEALRHPTWNMGRKISIDSATLLNKGYEIFETMYYFDKDISDIDVLIHRESIVHAVVNMIDGLTLLCCAVPDMRWAIEYALKYPDMDTSMISPLDLTKKPLTFAQPDLVAFPCLKHAIFAAKTGGFAGAVLAATGEVAVERFLDGSLSFNAISDCVEAAMKRIPAGDAMSLDDVLQVDTETRRYAEKYNLEYSR